MRLCFSPAECGGNAVSASNDSSTMWQELAAAQQGKPCQWTPSSQETMQSTQRALQSREWVCYLGATQKQHVEAGWSNCASSTITDGVIHPDSRILRRSDRSMITCQALNATAVVDVVMVQDQSH